MYFILSRCQHSPHNNHSSSETITSRLLSAMAGVLLLASVNTVYAQELDRNAVCELIAPAGRGQQAAFNDLGRVECWSCPEGHERSWSAVDASDACVKAASEVFVSARDRGAPTGVIIKTDCPDGAFLDVGKGRCYSCDSGYTRTAHSVTSGKACVRSVPATKVRATYHASSDLADHTTVAHMIMDFSQDYNSDGCSNDVIRKYITKAEKDDIVTEELNNFFKPACDNHDYCYESPWRADGKEDVGKAFCDQAFYEDMMQLCPDSPGGVCSRAAWIYFSAVSLSEAGQKAYDDAQDRCEKYENCVLND